MLVSVLCLIYCYISAINRVVIPHTFYFILLTYFTTHHTHTHTDTHAHTHTHMHNHFTALLNFVRDYLGELAPER